MSLFDVLKHQPVPDPLTQEYLDSLPPEVYLRYRVWLRKVNPIYLLTFVERKDKILELLENHNIKEPTYGNQSN